MNLYTALTLVSAYMTATRSTINRRIHAGDGEAGATTLEVVMITLGLIAVATLFVVAITAAVQRRVDQIN